MFIACCQPGTFRERGVAVPFTTPLLTRARLRAAPARSGAELEAVIPNPAGGRGVYILPWSRRGDMCRATVHDTRLGNVLAAHPELASLRPATVREAAWQVAAEGHAGRPAAAAGHRARHQQAVRLGLAASWLAAHLGTLALRPVPDGPARERLVEVLGDLHAPAGRQAPLRVLAEAVGALSTVLPDWAMGRSGPAAMAAQAVSAAAALAHRGACRLLVEAEARLDQPAALLRDWRADPGAVEELLRRADWLLDGWERLVLLWKAGLPSQAAVVLDMATLLPGWPDEAESWLNLDPGTAGQMIWRQGPPGSVGMLEQIARNERLRALAA